MPRVHDASKRKMTRIIGWILMNTRIGPVLNIKVCYRHEHYSVEVQIPSLFEVNTVSWVGIVNGVDTYVAETMLTKEEEDIASGKSIAKARPRQKPTETLTSVSIPAIERKWIDIEIQRSHDHRCYEVSNAIARLLRHDQSVPRGSDGAIPNSSNQFLYFRAKQGHSGKSGIDLALQDNVLLPKGFTEYIHHVGNANEVNSIIRNGIIPRGKSLKRGRPAVFFTAVNPMEDICGMGENPCDLTPRIAPYKNILVQFEARSRERLAILPDRVTCSRSLQHTACSLH